MQSTSSSAFPFSRLAYGVWRLADSPAADLTPEAVRDRILHCLNRGITTFDAADIYGGDYHLCERLFGAGLALLSPADRARMQIVTKCGIRCYHTPVKHYDLTPERIHEQVKNSLAAMQTPYIDLLLIHRPSPMLDPTAVASAFIELRASGKVREFGVSNFTPAQMAMLQSRLPFPLVTNQIEMHVLRLEPLHDGTLDDMVRLNIQPMAWSPLAGGRLFSAAAAAADPKVQAMQTHLAKVASELGSGVTVDQVAYAWILQHPSRPVPVIGSNNLARIDEAVKSLDVKLSLEQWFGIWQACAGTEVP